MTQSGSCWLIKFEPRETTDEITSEFFDDYFDVVAVNYTDDGLEEYVGYKDNSFDEQDFLAAAALRQIKLPPYKKEFLESRNWLKENVIKFAPVNVAEFTIYGIHETDIPDDGRINLKIYAATAFGSEHQTTKSCLQAISDYNKLLHLNIGICSQIPHTSPNIDFREENVSKSRSADAERTLSVREHSSIGICSQVPHKINILDMGTGSGILALAAARLWNENCKITAVDIDEEAVLVTRQNAVDNNLQKYVTAEVSDGYQSPLVKNNAPYDLILANILARPLISMAPDLYKSLKTGGYCILSGFVEEQEDWVIGEHTKLGLSLKQVYKMDNWRAALLEKK